MIDHTSIEAKRLKMIRKELRYTQSAFAKILNIPSTTADIERGKTKIPGFVVIRLMKDFNINPLWLFGESEEKHIEYAGKNISPKVITLDTQTHENILLVNQKAVAGYAHNIQDPQWYEQLPAFTIPLPEYRNATYRGFQIEGESMFPNIRPNEWVIGRAIGSVQDIIDNRVYVVVTKDTVMAKKLKKLPNSNILLTSYNENYLPFEISLHEVQELWLINSKISFGVEEDSNSYLLKQLQDSMRDLKSQINQISKTD